MPIYARYKNPRYVARRHAQYMHYYMQQRAENLKDQGLCVICGKRPARDEKLTCQTCIDKQTRSKRRPKGAQGGDHELRSEAKRATLRL